MLKILAAFSTFLWFTSLACGSEYVSKVTDKNGAVVGEVSLDTATAFQLCGDEPCEELRPVVCMTYGNDCPLPILCTLQVSAKFVEPFTGFTKKVTDTRDEIVFYRSQHEVCFNFGKDIYNNWFLTEVGEPSIDCVPFDSVKQTP